MAWDHGWRRFLVVSILVGIMGALNAGPVKAADPFSAAAHLELPGRLILPVRLESAHFRMGARPLPISITAPYAFFDWQAFIAREGPDYFECAEIIEMPGVVLCLFNQTNFMNGCLSRVLNFTDQWPDWKIPPAKDYRDPYQIPVAYSVKGINLRGRDIRLFHRVATKMCAAGQRQMCLTEIEQTLFSKFLLPLAEPGRGVAVLAVGRDNDTSISHELLHGQYYTSPRYRQTVAAFWDAMPEADRHRVLWDFDESFNTENLYVVQNEFQAFVLQGGTPTLLGWAKERHGEALKQALAEAGVPPKVRPVLRNTKR